MSKQNKLLASIVFFNLIPGLIIPNLTPKKMINDADYAVKVPAVLYSQANPEANLTTITAYSSTPDQTDSTPFITASGSYVKDGIVACNFLAFNTKIKLPELYGDKIFTVKDRMAKKNSHKIDIWFPTREEAKQFGVKKTIIEIVES